MGIDVPLAAGVSGVVRAEFTPNEREHRGRRWPISPAIRRSDVSGPDTTLTVRDGPFGERRAIAARPLSR